MVGDYKVNMFHNEEKIMELFLKIQEYMDTEIKGRPITQELLFKVQSNVEYMLHNAYKNKIINIKYDCSIVQCKKDSKNIHVGIGEIAICDCLERSQHVN